jgi:hypothetical protein
MGHDALRHDVVEAWSFIPAGEVKGAFGAEAAPPKSEEAAKFV